MFDPEVSGFPENSNASVRAARRAAMRGAGGATGLLSLAELRSRLVAQVDNDALVERAPTPVLSVGDAVEALCVAVDAADGDCAIGEDVDDGGDDAGGEALMGAALALETATRKLDALTAASMGRLEASRATEARCGLGTKAWKAARTHGSPATIARELAVARTVAHFGDFAAALRAGAISTDHVAALAAVYNSRVVDALVERQEDLVAFAERHHFRVFVTYLRRLVAMLDADGPQSDCGDRDRAGMGRDFEGHLHLRLELSGHNAVEAERIIKTETDRQYRAARREHETTGGAVPDLAVLRARAVIELLRRGASVEPNTSRPAVEAIVSITADHEGHPLAATSIDGGHLDALTAAVLICDAHLQPVVVDRSGNPLDLGRTTRFFTTAQRNAMILRDGGCTFPGCDQPASRCDAHHQIPWEHGGATDVRHAALLCRRHHGLVHGKEPWKILHLPVEELPAHLADQHHARAHQVRLEPHADVRVFQSPTGELHLAQNHTDHHGPAPP